MTRLRGVGTSLGLMLLMALAHPSRAEAQQSSGGPPGGDLPPPQGPEPILITVFVHPFHALMDSFSPTHSTRGSDSGSDHKLDNQLGDIIGALSAPNLDLAQEITEAIESGTVVLLDVNYGSVVLGIPPDSNNPPVVVIFEPFPRPPHDPGAK